MEKNRNVSFYKNIIFMPFLLNRNRGVSIQEKNRGIMGISLKIY